jgi:hypothetical protein
MITMLLHLFVFAALATDWHGDLQALEQALPAPQKDFAAVYPHFQSDLAALDPDLPKLPDSEIVLRLMKIMASANIGHNQVQTPREMGFQQRLPLMLYWYADGASVIAASEEYRRALGGRVLRIGTRTPEELISEMAPYVAHETDGWLRQQVMWLLPSRAVLEHLGLLDADGRVTLTLHGQASREHGD